jgi:hypothetical protein
MIKSKLSKTKKKSIKSYWINKSNLSRTQKQKESKRKIMVKIYLGKISNM